MPTPTPETRRSRPWLAWVVIAVAAAGLAASFFLSSSGPTGPASTPGPAAVALAPITRGSLTEHRRYPGELHADAADVAAFFPGRLLAVHVRVGDSVKAGQVLAELDPVETQDQLSQARAQVSAALADQQRARVEHAAATAEVARLEPLARNRMVSEQELEQQRARTAALAAAAEAAAARGSEAQARVRLLERRVLESRVRAPFSGRVAERYADPGATVPGGARLVRLVATAPLYVRFQVPEQEIAGLSVGAEVRVLTAAGATPPSVDLVAAEVSPPASAAAGALPARVSGIAGEVRRDQRVVAVEALVESAPPTWLPGMYAEVLAVGRALDDATLVPGQALLSRLQPDGRVQTGVFLLAGDRARWVPARVLAREGDRVAVQADLPADAQVLVAGHAELSDGGLVRAASPGAPASPGAGR